MVNPKQESATPPRPQLSLFDCVCVIVGIIIGSGIYKTSPLITGQTTGLSKWMMDSGWIPAAFADPHWLPLFVLIGTWLLGAGIALCGALCYAELASAYPHHGGDYIYLKRAFSPNVGFFFVWCEFWIIRPANIGAVGFVFSEYFLRLLGFDATPVMTTITTAGVVVALTLLNVLGVRSGIRTQNILSVIKVVGLLLVFCVAFLVPSRNGFEIIPFDETSAGGSFALAVVLIMFTLGGWNDLAFISGEVRNPHRNMFLSLVMGLACVTAVYILVTLAFVHGLGFGGVVQANEVASDLLQSRLGTIGSGLISGLICVSTLGAINGMLYAGARIYYALGREHRSFRYVGVWNDRWGGPVRGLGAQTLIALGLIVGFGLYENGFTRLVNFSTLFFWLFFFLVGVALFVLRSKEPDHPRPYRVMGYPWVPLLFCMSSVYVFYSSTNYALSVGGWEWAWAAIIVYAGLLVSACSPPPEVPSPETGIIQEGGKEATGPTRDGWLPNPKKLNRLAVILGLIGTFLSGAGTVTAWTASSTWLGELACHFPLQWLGIAAVSSLLLVFARRPWLSLVAAAWVTVNAFIMMGDAGDRASGLETHFSKPVRIASLNLRMGNPKKDGVLRVIREVDADLVVCLEVTEAWATALTKLRAEYRFQEISARNHAFGIAVLSRRPMGVREVNPSASDRPQLLVKVSTERQAVWYLGATHVDPPMQMQMRNRRDLCLQEWSRELLAQDSPVLMIGDFNSTPWSPIFTELVDRRGWRDSRWGHGNQSTWPAWIGGWGIPIDHALCTPGIKVLNRSTFDIPGSDHRGVALEIQVPLRDGNEVFTAT